MPAQPLNCLAHLEHAARRTRRSPEHWRAAAHEALQLRPERRVGGEQARHRRALAARQHEAAHLAQRGRRAHGARRKAAAAQKARVLKVPAHD